jgi:hypothetical protein
MLALAAVLLAAAPLSATEALPRGVTALGGVTVEIVQAERVTASAAGAGELQRNIRREPKGLLVQFN